MLHRSTLVVVMLFGFLAPASDGPVSAGEIYYKPPTKVVRRPGGGAAVVPGLQTTSDHGLGISGQIQEAGVWITDVEAHGPAAGIGLEVLDFIVSVNKRRIRTPQDWDQELRKSGSLILAVKDHRTGNTVSRTVTLAGRRK